MKRQMACLVTRDLPNPSRLRRSKHASYKSRARKSGLEEGALHSRQWNLRALKYSQTKNMTHPLIWMGHVSTHWCRLSVRYQPM
jgi:hypothetical protein